MTTIFSPKKGTWSLAATWLQRWAIVPSAYNYDICYEPTRKHCNTDDLSRLPLPAKETLQIEEGVLVIIIGQFPALPVTLKKIKTTPDMTLSWVRLSAMWWKDGQSNGLRKSVLTWGARRNTRLKMDDFFGGQKLSFQPSSLEVQGGIHNWKWMISLGAKSYHSKLLQALLLQSPHKNQQGITRMKVLAWSYFWCTSLDKAIEDLGKSCAAWQAN